MIYRLEPDGDGTRVFFEHSGFDMSQPWGEQAFRGAEFVWAKMLERLGGCGGVGDATAGASRTQPQPPRRRVARVGPTH